MTDIWKALLRHLTDLHSLIDLRNLKEEIVMEIVSKTEGSKVTMEITGWLDTRLHRSWKRSCQHLILAQQAWYLTLQTWNISLPPDFVW